VILALVVPQLQFFRRRREKHQASEAARLVDELTDNPATEKAGA
jgi:putative ABC transport system permease protein